mgnify:CR=1 FL=1
MSIFNRFYEALQKITRKEVDGYEPLKSSYKEKTQTSDAQIAKLEENTRKFEAVLTAM